MGMVVRLAAMAVVLLYVAVLAVQTQPPDAESEIGFLREKTMEIVGRPPTSVESYFFRTSDAPNKQGTLVELLKREATLKR
jgi:hypothetical protein